MERRNANLRVFVGLVCASCRKSVGQYLVLSLRSMKGFPLFLARANVDRGSFYPGSSLTGVGCPIWRARFRYQPHRKPETAKAGVNAVAGHGKPELQPSPFRELRSNRVTTGDRVCRPAGEGMARVERQPSPLNRCPRVVVCGDAGRCNTAPREQGSVGDGDHCASVFKMRSERPTVKFV